MTKKLSYIFFSILAIFLSYLFVRFFDNIVYFFEGMIEKINPYEVVIPESNPYRRTYVYKTFNEVTSFEPKNIEDIKDIYYTVLNNGWDNFTFYCKKDYPTCSEDVRKVANDKEFISLINNYVSPYNSFKSYNTTITGDKNINLEIIKQYSDEEIDLVNKKLDEILLDLKINKDKLSITDIKNLHHYLIYYVTYDDKYKEGDVSASNKASGALLNGKSICSGYSDSFALMMDRLNIPNFKISNDEHIWNIVKINNLWSHIDVTWDDDEKYKDNRSNFFLLSTDELLKIDPSEHEFNKTFYKEIK